MIKSLFFLIAVLFVSSCANKPCRDPQTEAGRVPVATPDPKTEPAVKTAGRVFVAKPDGSKQCKGTGVSEATMQKELKGITVHSNKKDHDGLMRIQMCGADTGRFNVYEIDSKDLEKAKSLGFSEWKK